MGLSFESTQPVFICSLLLASSQFLCTFYQVKKSKESFETLGEIEVGKADKQPWLGGINRLMSKKDPTPSDKEENYIRKTCESIAGTSIVSEVPWS